MPLSPSDLTTQFTALFSSPPDSVQGCADLWGDALLSYAQGIVPASITVAAAAEALKSDLNTIFSETTGVASTTASLMETAFLQFATSVGSGMTGFTAVPPPGVVGFSLLFELRPTSTSEAVSNFVTSIDAWMRTGTATRTTTPFDTLVWS